MTRKEAVQKARACQPVHPAPYNLDFTQAMRQRMAQHFGTDDVDEAIGNSMLQINVGSNAGAEVNRIAAGLMTPLTPGFFEDEFGVVWDKTAGDDIGVPANTRLPDPDLALFNLPDPADPRRWARYDAVAATVGDRYLLACFSSPFFQRAWFLRGMANFLEDLALNEAFVDDLLDQLLHFSLGIVREVARRKADGIIFYDDYAQQSGLLFSPDMFRRFFAPRLATLVQAARTSGLDVFFHSCGNVTPILEDLCATGIQVFNPFQPEVMNVGQVARRFAGRLAFYGGVSTQHTLPQGTPEDVRREVRTLLSIFRDQGGCILAPAHAIQIDVPIDNVLALLDAVRS
jgi:uroporphyrinogen decarboxylase